MTFITSEIRASNEKYCSFVKGEEMGKNGGECLFLMLQFRSFCVYKMKKKLMDKTIHFKQKRIKYTEYLSGSCHNNKKWFIVKR